LSQLTKVRRQKADAVRVAKAFDVAVAVELEVAVDVEPEPEDGVPAAMPTRIAKKTAAPGTTEAVDTFR
jgi:hypothetical protein